MTYGEIILMWIGHAWDWLERLLSLKGLADPNMTTVEHGLYLSGFLTRPPKNIDFIISVAHEDNDDQWGVPHAWRPWHDFPPGPTIAELQEVVLMVVKILCNGRTVLVHCDQGNHRSATVVVAVLMYTKGWGVLPALAFVQKARPTARPHSWQIELLHQYGRHLHVES